MDFFNEGKESSSLKDFISSAEEIFQEMNLVDALDVMTFRIYLDNFSETSSSYSHSVIDLCIELKSFCEKYAKEYIWFKSLPQIQCIMSSDLDSPVPIYIEGSLEYGDCIDDEWFLCYILLEFSLLFPEISISMEDSDGQFLLIEAADYIPSWMDPDNAINRVWIRKGEIHIISDRDGEEGKNLSLVKALKRLSGAKKEFVASLQVQSCIYARTLNVYPAKIMASYHNVVLYLPNEMIHVIQTDPQVLSFAINEYCAPDVKKIRNKYKKQMKSYRNRFQGNQHSLSKVVLTRSLYAKLTFKEFTVTEEIVDFYRSALEELEKGFEENLGKEEKEKKIGRDGKKNGKEIAKKCAELSCRVLFAFEIAFQSTKDKLSELGYSVSKSDIRQSIETSYEQIKRKF